MDPPVGYADVDSEPFDTVEDMMGYYGESPHVEIIETRRLGDDRDEADLDE